MKTMYGVGLVAVYVFWTTMYLTEDVWAPEAKFIAVIEHNIDDNDIFIISPQKSGSNADFLCLMLLVSCSSS